MNIATNSSVFAVFLLSLIKAPASVTTANQASQQLFPVAILPKYLTIAMIAATISTIIAAILPARRAAKLNPVDIMR